jgi:hypothetical protein
MISFSAASPSTATFTSNPERDKKGANRSVMAVSSSTRRSLGLVSMYILYTGIFLKIGDSEELETAPNLTIVRISPNSIQTFLGCWDLIVNRTLKTGPSE